MNFQKRYAAAVGSSQPNQGIQCKQGNYTGFEIRNTVNGISVYEYRWPKYRLFVYKYINIGIYVDEYNKLPFFGECLDLLR